jgi:hypothetical protein
MSTIMRCQSVKSKNVSSQCLHNAKNGDIFCGIHQKSKSITLFIHSVEYPVNESKVLLNIYPVSSQDLINSIENSFIQSDELIIENQPVNIIHNNDNVSTNSSVKVQKMKKKVICKKTSSISIFERFLPKIIKIQRWIRTIWRDHCIKCTNDSDFLSFENLVDIPYPKLFFIQMTPTITYGFHIQSIYQYIDNCLKDNPNKPIRNPYTSSNFDDQTIIQIQEKAMRLKIQDIVSTPSVPMDPEQEFRQYILNIFQKMDMLDNYTDMNWFINLDMYQLKNLYYTMVDTWTYRCQMPLNVRENIVKDGVAFPVKYELIRQFSNTSKNKRRLQYIILDEIDRFITQGKTRDDRKLGCMLMLTSLVEISPEAANSMPQYIQ